MNSLLVNHGYENREIIANKATTNLLAHLPKRAYKEEVDEAGNKSFVATYGEFLISMNDLKVLCNDYDMRFTVVQVGA